MLRQHYSADVRMAAVAGRREGMRYGQIAAALGVPMPTLVGWVREDAPELVQTQLPSLAGHGPVKPQRSVCTRLSCVRRHQQLVAVTDGNGHVTVYCPSCGERG